MYIFGINFLALKIEKARVAFDFFIKSRELS